MDLSGIRVAEDGTHHLIDGRPLYARQYRWVLKYHPPGLAPACDESGAFHIDLSGQPVYDQRFVRTFGFYEDRAAVVTEEGWGHIDPAGARVYPPRFSWVGNFQEGLCAVRTGHGDYYHILPDGSAAYPERYRYVGDYRDGVAVVQAADGRLTHTDSTGQLVHGQWSLDLDVFHKGFARARDENGWMHVNRVGRPAYKRRFVAVEPFYNGQARVERDDGGLEVIGEDGRTLVELRRALVSPLQQLSDLMVGFWSTQTIRAAVELGVLDALPATEDELGEATPLAPGTARRILRALWELDIVVPDGSRWLPTEKGRLLRRDSPSGVAEAAMHWATEHYRVWEELPQALSSGRSMFEELYGEVFFGWLTRRPEKLERYRVAMSGYAEHDYQTLPEMLDLRGVKDVVDAGGGSGALVCRLLEVNPDLRGVLFDLPEVVATVRVPDRLRNRLRTVGGDLFAEWPCSGDVVMLARVLHDWDDECAQRILRRARQSLRPGGRIYLVEMVLSDEKPEGGLLDLNMLVVCGARERTLDEWSTLVSEAGLIVVRVTPNPSYGALIELRPG